MLQRQSVQELHGDERLAILLADVVDRADVGMVERGSGLRFALKAGQGLRVARDLIWQELQCNRAAKASVLCLVDDAHATAAEFFKDGVMRNGATDNGGSICH